MIKRALLVLFLFTAGGLIAGLVIGPPVARRQVEGANTRWTSYGAPPEPAARILGYEFFGQGLILVRVESPSGEVYRCCEQDPGEWTKAPPSDLVYSDGCPDLPSQAPPSPGPVVDCVEAGTYEWGTSRTRFALLDDGAIWTWRHSFGIAPAFFLTCRSVLAGALLGIAAVALMAVLRRRRGADDQG